MKRAVLMSVPHTGTNFTSNIFRGAGWEVLNLYDRPHKRNVLHRAHVLKASLVDRSLSMGLPIVCPLRHPYWVEETWRRHKKDVAQLVQCFHTLIDRYRDAHIFVIDSDDREAQIRGLSEFIGEDFETDWHVVASKQNTHSLRLEDLSPSDEIMRLAEGEFFQRFYGRSRTEICS